MPTERTAVKIASPYNSQRIPVAGFHTEMWRIPTGDVGDTAVIKPSSGRAIISVQGAAVSHNLPVNGNGQATVTLTYVWTSTSAQDVTLYILP